MFDNYTLKARFYPVIILFLPLIITGIFYSFEFKSIIHLLSSLGLVGALTYLFSQLGRDKGKLMEPLLWKRWGGAPSTQIMRFRDTHIDKYTKKRYHDKMQTLCSISVIPNPTLEANSPTDCDEVYLAWTKYLISHTRDETKFTLLLKDNTSYGFRRNLWGLKGISIVFILLLIILNYLFWAIKISVWNPVSFPDSFMYSQSALIAVLFFWIFVITSNWVKIPAFSYAERLFEASEVL